jgi:hypothetical protein
MTIPTADLAAIRLSCSTCRSEYIALGATPEIAAHAASSGPTCCPPIVAPSVGEAPDGSTGAGGSFLPPGPTLTADPGGLSSHPVRPAGGSPNTPGTQLLLAARWALLLSVVPFALAFLALFVWEVAR